MRQNDTRGSMPFAVIAVTLLLASVALAAMVQGHERAERGAETVIDDIDAVDEAVADITDYVNRGLGEVVMGLSKASDGDTLEKHTVAERAESFKEKAAKWIEFQFPIRSSGAVASLVSHDVSLAAAPMQLASEGGAGGYSPTYLVGDGTIDVIVESESGRAEVTLDVSTDGSYALPLSAERAELFRSMATEGPSSLSQMVTYQLTCLAQHRVMNGYGSTGQYGTKGTDAIITADDVRRAYASALEAVAMESFRDADNGFASVDQVDLADLLADDGMITLDLSAVYAQALASVIDDIAIRWFDYFCGFQLADELDRQLNPYRNAVASLVAFIFGEERVYSAVPYVEKVMELNGIPESQYRLVGSGTSTVSAGGITVSVPNPEYDVISAQWLRAFSKGYLQDTNFVMEFILSVVRGAATAVAENRDLGTVGVPVDPYDGTSYAETLAELLNRAMGDCEGIVEDALSERLSQSEVYDPFYGAIADEISAHRGEMVMDGQLEASLRAAFAAAIPEDSDVTMETLERSGALERALQSYRAKVASDLQIYDDLRRVESDGSLVKRVLTEICAFGLERIGITDRVPAAAEAMCGEAVATLQSNPHGGVADLPGTTGFRMDDGLGNITYERISAEVASNLVVGPVSIDREECWHTVGFRENLSAAYSTVFTVTLSDFIDLRLTGSGALSSAMGTDSSVLRDSVKLEETEIRVAVVSSWALAGIEYKPTDTIYQDIWNELRDILEPIIEPLRKVLEGVRGVITEITESLMEALSYVAEKLMAIYQAIYQPVESLKAWIEDAAERVLSDAALEVLVSIAMNEQKVTLHFLDCVFEFSTKAVTWTANTKTLLTASVTVPVSGLVVTAGVTAKARGDVSAENLIVTGFGGVEGEDWEVEMTLDPLMKGSRYLITMDAEVNGTDIAVVAPKLDNYHEMGIAVSDVPGIGDVVSNIPLGGVNVGLDAGFSIKYSNPEKTGLIVNEFETNPPGDDKGNEWVELYNNSMSSIDLTGYTMMAASDRRSKTMELSGTIGPGEFLVIHPDFTLVNSSGKYTTKGEAIIIKDAEGNEIERTPTKKDGQNDGFTWQRSYDGSTEWVFAQGTMGGSNESFPGAHLVTAADMKECVWRAVERSFDRVETITDLETLQTFMQYMVRFTLEELIGHVSGQVVEASVYVSVDVKDPSSSVSTGVRVALRTDGELVKDVLKYAIGRVMELALNVRNPYRIDPVGMFTENIDLEVSFHTGIGYPDVLGSLAESADLPELDLGVTFRTNVAGITRLLGTDTGRPEVVMGVRLIDCPDAAIPSKLSARQNMEQDLWFMLVTVRFARS